MNRAVRRVALAILSTVPWACAGGGDSEQGGSVVPTGAVTTQAGAVTTQAGAVPPSAGPETVLTLPGSTTPASTSAPPAPPALPDPACAPAPDRRITDLPDAEAAAIVGEPFDLPAREVGDVTIPAVHVAGFTIPAQAFDGGCLIEFDAPGGCLGAIEMTGVTLPEIRVPGYVIDAVVIDGEQVAERIVVPPTVIAGASAPAVRLEQDCEIQSTSDGAALALIRDQLVRQAAIRPEGARPGAHRPAVCVDEECSPALSIDNVVIPQASISEVVIPELVVLVQPVRDAPAAQVVEVPGQTAYTAPVDVLFDVEAAELRPDAAPSLEAIAAEIRLAPPASTVTVEGHTDSDGDTAYNEDLSLRRAQAVSDWLVSVGGIAADRITTVGLGERVPVTANDTAEGRAQNRRVVISVSDG